jgi:hypothetical protein
MSACRPWNEKPATEKTWTHFKSHLQPLTVITSICKGKPLHDGFHSANATMTHNEDHMAEATIGALANAHTFGKASAQIPQPPLMGDDSPPWGR